MDTAYLDSFLLVVDAGSISEAARRLDLTPAAVAQQVRVLEKALGAPLLARAGRTVQPTEAGHRLAQRARNLVREIDALKDVVTDDTTVDELIVGSINTALHGLLPDMLTGFVARFPQARVLVRSGQSTELFEAVESGRVDVAICQHPTYTLSKTLRWELLREEALTVLAPQRWARRDPHELLASEPLIRYDRRLGGGKLADRYLRQAGIQPTERFELDSLAAIAMLVDRGLGVSLTPDIGATWWPGLRVARVPLPIATRSRRFGLLWRRSASRNRLIRALVDEGVRVARGAN